MTPATRKPGKWASRTADFTLTRSADDSSDGLTLEGYAAVFGTPTLIDSWEGNFNETIKRGAFAKTIRDNTPVLQFDHGRHPLVGSIPIGTIQSLREDDHGLSVSARLTDNWLTQPVRQAIEQQSIKGMSFRFEVMRDEWRDVNGKLISNLEELQRLLWDAGDRGPIERTLKEVKLRELGPVVWPAYPETEVSVRSQEVVHALRDPNVRHEVEALWAQQLKRTVDPQESEEDTPVTDHLSEGDREESTQEVEDAPTGTGHPSRNLRNAQLARLAGRIDVAERRYLRDA